MTSEKKNEKVAEKSDKKSSPKDKASKSAAPQKIETTKPAKGSDKKNVKVTAK